MKKRLIYIPLLLIPIIGIIFGTLFDFEISKNIYSTNNVIAIIGSVIALVPVFGILAVLLGLMFSSSARNRNSLPKPFVIVAHILATIGIILAIYFQGSDIVGVNGFGAINDAINKKYIGILISAAIYLPFLGVGIYLGQKIKDKNSLYLILALLIAVMLVEGIYPLVKLIDIRPRYRLYVATQDNSLLVNWWNSLNRETYNAYRNVGIASEEFKSFPSGHTAGAALLSIVLFGACNIFPKYKKLQYRAILIGVLWAMIIAICRMVLAAHYLSDVSFGFLLTTIIFIAFNEFIIRFTSFHQPQELKA